MDVIAEIDAWLSEDKTLDGFFPGWSQAYGRDHTARWGILDSLGIQRGELAFTVDRWLQKPTIVVLMERRPIFRTDIVPEGEVKPNPPWAAEYQLPPTVTGSHVHPWEANKEWIKANGFIGMPARAPVSRALRTLEHALATTADAVNIVLNNDQRDCRLPPRTHLL